MTCIQPDSTLTSEEAHNIVTSFVTSNNEYSDGTFSPAACEIRGQVFTECGTACPSVCGEEAAVFCTLQCVRGCQCPGGTMLDTLSKQCVTPDQCSPGTHF